MPEIQKKIELLQKIAHRFNEANIEWALGASMLLYFKGIISEFHDIDFELHSNFSSSCNVHITRIPIVLFCFTFGK